MHPVRVRILALLCTLAFLVAGCDGSSSRNTAPTAPRTDSATPTVPGSAIPTSSPRQTLGDLAYAARSPLQKLDLYLPPGGTAPYPLVVFVHGGAWVTGDKAGELARALVPVLLAQDYAVASINYRLAPQARFPAQIHDLKSAIRWLRAHAAEHQLDAGRFAVLGESAGAHLAALLATSEGVGSLDDATLGNAGVSSRVRAALLFYPPVDLLADRNWLRTNRACARGFTDPDAPTSGESKLLGAPVQKVPDRATAANPLTYLTTGSALPEVYVAHGTGDCVVPYQGSLLLYGALLAHGAHAELHLVPGSGHYTDFDWASQAQPVLAFLHRTLQPS